MSPLAAFTRRLRATARVWRVGRAHMAMLVSPDGRDQCAADASPVPPDSRRTARGVIDLPAAGATVTRSPLRIWGWAVGETGPCSRVELTLDDRPVGLARLGDPRPDLEWLGLDATLSGFHHWIDLSELPYDADQAVVGGFGVSFEGERFALPSVSVRLADPPVVRPKLTQKRRRVAPRDRDQLRLLVCTHELTYGGAQLFLTELLRQVCDHGRAGGLVVTSGDGPTRTLLEQLGFDVHVTAPYPIRSWEAYSTRLDELASWVRSEGEFDVAFVNTVLAFPGGELAARLDVPSVWAIHESHSLPMLWALYGDELDPLVRASAEAALNSAAAVAFTCDATRECYEPYLPSVPCVTLPYGIDLDSLDRWRQGFDRRAAREDLGLDPHATVILCMGTIEPRKAQTQLVHAFAHVADRHPDATLLIVGSRGDAAADAARLAVAIHGLEGRVRILPVVADALPIYGVADLLVSASDNESTPRSILEAMALELPVLSARAFGVGELITDPQTGWLCEPRDVAAMAGALERVLSLSVGEREDVARRARTIAERDYRSDVCSRAWDELLREVASARAEQPSALTQ